MNIAPISPVNCSRAFAGKKEKVNYSNNGAGENVPQPSEKKEEKPTVTWHNYGGFAYPVEHKPDTNAEPKDDRRFNKL